MRKLFVFLFSSLITLLSTSVLADGYEVKHWIDENGYARETIIENDDPPLTDQQLRDMKEDARSLRSSDYYDFDVVSDGPFDVQLKQRGTGKVITIHK